MGLRGGRVVRADPPTEDRRLRFRQAKAWLRDATGRQPLRDSHPEARREAHTEPAFEQHLSVDELADTWGLSRDFVRRMFLKEPGVVVFHHQRPGRRVYRTLRIPESVAMRVHTRMRQS